MLSGLTVTAVIPARMASSRFPGKPLAKILGIPMIEHVRRRIAQMDFIDQAIVATCDAEIIECVRSNGGNAVMTSPDHPGATDRVAEAARSIKTDLVINIQGDEPLVLKDPLIKLTRALAENSKIGCSNLVFPICNETDLRDPNIVKSALSQSGRLIYLTRSPIPARNFSSQIQYWKQAGLIAFRHDALMAYANAPRTPLETQEGIDVLRLLENDIPVQAVPCEVESIGVDVPDQLIEAGKMILADPIQRAIFESIQNKGLKK